MKLAAVIVTYNSADHIDGCLESCARFAADLDGGIYVVDNASADDSCRRVQRHAGAVLIVNGTNRGFAAAVNQGMTQAARSDAVLILNPDAKLLDSPRRLADELADPGVGAAGGQLLSDTGEPQRGFQVRRFPTAAALVFENFGLNRLWPGNPVNRRYRCLDLDPGAAADVEQPAGACLLVRRTAWAEAGGLDEGFFPVWFEDVDFLKRLAQLGWRARYTPAFRARHSGGHSVTAVERSLRQVYWYGSLLRYAGRHFGVMERWVIGWSVVIGGAPRALMGLMLEQSAKPMSAYVKVVRIVVAYLWRGRIAAHPAEIGG